VWRLRNASAYWVAHGVMVGERRWLCPGGCTQILLRGVWSTCSHSSIADALACLICWVVQQSTDIVNEQRVQKLGDFLFVREVQRAIEGYPVIVSITFFELQNRIGLPDTFQVHWTNLYNVSSLLTLQDTIATSTCHSGNVQQFCAVDHMVVLTPGHANAIRLDLKAEATFVFPKSRGDSRLHAMRCDLATGVDLVCCKRLPRWRCLSSRCTHGRKLRRLRDHARTHRRRHWVPSRHWCHAAGVAICISVWRVWLRSRLECLRLAVRVLAYTLRWSRSRHMCMIDVHV